MTGLLVAVDFLDEFAGTPFVGAPDIQGAFGLGYGTAAFVLFALPALVAILLEPPLYVLADRWPRKPFVVFGLAVLGVCLVVAGLASSLVVLACAMAFAGPACGIGVNLAQATLMDAHPDQRERMMARWTFMGALGDLATPALFAALALVGLGWREAFLVTGGLFLVYALALVPFRFPAAVRSDDEPLPPLRQALAGVARNHRLLVWLFAVSLCGMLDEVLVAFAALHLDVGLGAGVAGRSLVLAAFMFGELAGLLTLDRLLRRVEPLRMLRWASAACSVCYLAWIAAPGVRSSAALFAAVGLFAAPLYPIAQAQAYRALPGQSGLVIAAGQVFAPLELALPLLVGTAADRFGLPAALTLLVCQPLGIFIVALIWRRRSRSE